MAFIRDNWQLIFGGLGTGIIVAMLTAYLKFYFDRKAKAEKPSGSISQKIQAGDRSVNVQAGRDADVSSR